MNDIHKFVMIPVEDLMYGTGVVVDLDIKTDKICIIKNLKDLIIFPITNEKDEEELDKITLAKLADFKKNRTGIL